MLTFLQKILNRYIKKPTYFRVLSIDSDKLDLSQYHNSLHYYFDAIRLDPAYQELFKHVVYITKDDREDFIEVYYDNGQVKSDQVVAQLAQLGVEVE